MQRIPRVPLGTLAANVEFTRRIVVLSAIAFGMTVGVYGLVAGIVKLDDAGLGLVANERKGSLHGAGRMFGRGILVAAPWLMKFLSVAGTAAMFVVGGEILLHGIPGLHAPDGLVGTLVAAATGLAIGMVAVGIVTAGKRLFGKKVAV